MTEERSKVNTPHPRKDGQVTVKGPTTWSKGDRGLGIQIKSTRDDRPAKKK